MNKIVINDYKNYLSSNEKKGLMKVFTANNKLIVDTLNLDYNFPTITYYLFPTEKIKIQQTGEDGYAETDRDKFAIYMVYNDDIKPIGPHEAVHLLTNHLGIPNFVFSDGLAEYFELDWRNDIDNLPIRLGHDEWVKRYINDGTYISISDLFDDYRFWELDQNATISYPESGSFIKFLVKKYGINKVMEAYQHMKRRPKDLLYNYNIFQNIFCMSIEKAEKDWLEYIRKNN